MKAPLRLAINSRQHRAPRLLIGARVEGRLADSPHLEADLSRRLVVDDVAAVEDESLVRGGAWVGGWGLGLGAGAGGAGPRGLAKRIQLATGYVPALASRLLGRSAKNNSGVQGGEQIMAYGYVLIV